jgi:hypothetical protein
MNFIFAGPSGKTVTGPMGVLGSIGTSQLCTVGCGTSRAEFGSLLQSVSGQGCAPLTLSGTTAERTALWGSVAVSGSHFFPYYFDTTLSQQLFYDGGISPSGWSSTSSVGA